MKAVVFDLDGTLLDSMGFWSNLGKSYLASIGVKAHEDLNDTLEGLTLEDGISFMKEEYKISKTSDQMEEEMEKFLLDFYKEEAKPKPYAREFLEKLKNMGVKMAIASLTDEYLIREVLKRYDLLDYFEFIQTPENTGIIKGSKTFFELLVERLDLKCDEIIVFEDALYAIEAAKSAGIRVVGVEDDSAKDDREAIINSADLYIKSFKEYIDILDKED